jgi:uncharacterized cupin superfamily protein
MRHARMQTHDLDSSSDLIDSTLPRSAHVTEGDPHVRLHDLGSSPDGNLTYCLWQCTRGSFRIRYTSDEIVHILDGGALITPIGGVARTVGPGDVVYFEQGLVADWRIDDHIKKLAILRSVDSSIVHRVVGRVREMLAPALRTLHLAPGKQS